MHYIGKILPIDGYKVRLRGQLPIDYAVSLTHLYQPLIGMDGVMFYQTLLNEVYVQIDGDMQTHHTLMNYVQQPLDVIYEARLKLEGIGLVRTYKDMIDKRTCYTYEVQCPFSPEQFFQDAMLSELLYHHIGKNKFNILKDRLCGHIERGGEEITASFKDVFQTFQPTFVAGEYKEVHPTPSIQQSSSLQIELQSIRHALARKMIDPDKVLTRDNKQLISQMMELYQLDSIEVGRCLSWALSPNNEVNEQSFKQACAELFRTKNRTANIQLTKRQSTKQPEHPNTSDTKERSTQPQEKQNKKPSRREVLLSEFETMSPAQLLSDHSKTGIVEQRDIDIVQEVMHNQGLTPPVMNVLLHYVFIQQNKQLSKNYLRTIASHWSRVGFTTAKEALEFAQSVNERYAQAKQKHRTAKKKTQSEVLPDWYAEHMKQIEEVEQAKEQKRKENEEQVDEGEVEKELEELIRSVSKK